MAITLVLAIIWDGKIYLWESIVLVLFYITYVSVVVVGNWWAKGLKRRKWQEQKARDEYNPTLGVNAENPEIPVEDDYGSQDAYGYESYDETDLLLPEVERRDRTTPISMSNISRREASEHSFLSAGETVDQAMHFHKHKRPALRGTRPSFFGAIEFRDVVNSLKLDSNSRPFGAFGRSYTSDFYTRSRTLPYNNRFNNGEVRRRSWASYSGTTESHNPITSDVTLNTSSRLSNDSRPPSISNMTNYSQESNSDQIQPDTPRPLHLTIVPPTPLSTSSLSPVQLYGSPLSMSPRDENFQTSPFNSTYQMSNDLASLSPKVSPVLSPVLQQSKSLISLRDNITALMAFPAFLLLTLTLPVVSVDDCSTGDDEINPIENQSHHHLEPPTI
ncbi:12998_t:CDS:2, partial [Acaulospora colombiana]